MDRGAWRATVYGVTEELDSTVYLNNNEDELRPLLRILSIAFEEELTVLNFV